MFRVERSQLMDQIWNLTKAESALLTGSPGVGKSWTIAQLIRRCRTERRPHLAVAAEDFDVSSIDDLTSALGFKREVLPFLESLGKGAILIVDGLDALRSETSQRAFRELIARVNARIPRCAILASVRTFDFQQSDELQRLFFGGRASLESRKFNLVVVEPFSDSDLDEVVKQVAGMEELLRVSGEQLRELLRNPFNLNLAVQLLHQGAKVQELSGMQSQVQLLNNYWALRVERPQDGQDRKAFLRTMVSEMVERRSLSLPEERAYKPGLSSVFKGLQSDEILRESVTDRISFTHNILFDYGLARLILNEESVFSFVRQDTNRTIFFRPSLSFFFHHLWFKDRKLFWKVAFQVFSSTDLPERAVVVPAVAIYEAILDSDELSPLVADASPASDRGIAATLRAVQSFGGMQSRRRNIWLAVLQALSSRLSLSFVNEYVGLLNLASEGASAGDRRTISSNAMVLLGWMWDSAVDDHQAKAAALADLGAARVFPLVMRFYASDPDGSKAIVLRVLSRFGSLHSGSHEAFWLAREIKPIIRNDPNLAVEVYRRMFRHKEESEAPTNIGGSAVLPLISNRRQDFSTAVYGLQAAFSTFLEVFPIFAASAAVEAMRGDVERERLGGPIHDNPRSFRFVFSGREVEYFSDFSEIWDSGSREYVGLSLLARTLSEIATLLSSVEGESAASQMIQVIAERGVFAVAWKRLLESAAANSRAFYSHIAELLTVPQLISAPETTIAVGNVIKAAYANGLVGNLDALAIEHAISEIPKTDIILRYEKPESIQNRLLLCIPVGEVHSAELRDLAKQLAETEKVRENRPYHNYSFSQGIPSSEELMREKGVDTSEPQNARAINILERLSEFANKHVNQIPSVEACTEIEPYLTEMNDFLSSPRTDAALVESSRGSLCAAAETVLKNADQSKDQTLVKLCRSIVLRGATDPLPIFDPKYHLPFDMPSWGSPLPRIEAAQGLARLLWNWGNDSAAIEAFERLSRDEVPAVRFQVASNLLAFYKNGDIDDFWRLTAQMLASERTSGVMLALMDTLGRISGREPERVVDLLSLMIERGLPSTERSELSQGLLGTLTGLYIVRANSRANEQLLAFEADPLKFRREIGEEVSAAAHYLTPKNAPEPEARERSRELLRRVLNAAYAGLQDLDTGTPSEEAQDSFRDLIRIVDDVAFRVFITLDIDPQLRNDGSGLTDSARREAFVELQPVIELLTLPSIASRKHHLPPNTAQNLMQTFNTVLDYDPIAVIKYAAAVCRAARGSGYPYDPMAIAQLVKLVERVLADHKDLLRDTSTANAVGEMLDIFVSVGWPEALQLTFRMDQAIR
jgi:hypothetical protein